jgi:integrase
MAKLLYAGRLRLMECLRLRVQDLDVVQHQIIVHDDNGMEDRVTMLPASLVVPLQDHLARVQRLHAQDVAHKVARNCSGGACVQVTEGGMPFALC